MWCAAQQPVADLDGVDDAEAAQHATNAAVGVTPTSSVGGISLRPVQEDPVERQVMISLDDVAQREARAEVETQLVQSSKAGRTGS